MTSWESYVGYGKENCCNWTLLCNINLIDILKMHEQYFTAKKMNGELGLRRGRKSTITAPAIVNGKWEAAWRRSRIITMTMKTNTLLMMMMTTTKYVGSMFMTLLPPLPLGHSLSYINYLTNSSKIVQLHLLPHFLVVVVFTLIASSASLLSFFSLILLLFIFYFAHKYGKHYIFLM